MKFIYRLVVLAVLAMSCGAFAQTNSTCLSQCEAANGCRILLQDCITCQRNPPGDCSDLCNHAGNCVLDCENQCSNSTSRNANNLLEKPTFRSLLLSEDSSANSRPSASSQPLTTFHSEINLQSPAITSIDNLWL